MYIWFKKNKGSRGVPDRPTLLRLTRPPYFFYGSGRIKHWLLLPGSCCYNRRSWETQSR